MQWIVAGWIGCGTPAPEVAPPATPVAAAAPRAVRPPPSADKAPEDRTVADIAVASPDHGTLVAALTAAGLVDALASPGGVYTVFAPTDAAFAKLPAGTVDGLLEPASKPQLQKVLKHHALVPVMLPKDLTDGQVLSMSDGTKVTVHVDGEKVKVGDANVLGSVQGMNGIVYVIDAVLLPPT
ncbi:MAG: fasciclin domain-containing protein [Myxococcota bacterium]